MRAGVVEAAEQPAVVEAGAATVGPGDLVVRLGPAGWAVAALGRAATVPHRQRDPLRLGVEPGPAPHVEHDRRAVEHLADNGGDDAGLAGPTPSDPGGDDLPGVQPRGAEPGQELVDVAQPDHGR